jgi:hypothetical protein
VFFLLRKRPQFGATIGRYAATDGLNVRSDRVAMFHRNGQRAPSMWILPSLAASSGVLPS